MNGKTGCSRYWKSVSKIDSCKRSNDVCWPSNAVICSMTCINERTLQRQLKEMQKIRVLEVVSRHVGKSGKGRTSNETKINWQTLEDLHQNTLTPPPGDTLTPGGGVRVSPDLIQDIYSRSDPSLSLKSEPRERETIANAQRAKEGTATALVLPETKSNLGQNIPKLKGQCSAAAAPPEIFEINQWADFRAPGNHPEFWTSVLNQAQKFKDPPPASPDCAAEAWIQKRGHLLWCEFKRAHGNGNGNSHTPQRHHVEIPCPKNGQWYRENPVIDLAEDIALVQVHWRRLYLSDDKFAVALLAASRRART